jgi:PadR family transcriptional regulator PadR
MNPEIAQSINKSVSQMRKGTLEFCILLIISRKKVYASDILDTLKEVHLIVVEGTLYPLLSRLKKEGLLNYSWEESASGPPRKYYSLTEKGEDILKGLKEHWLELQISIHNLINKA